MALCNAVCAVPRALVSQNKRRFRDGGFDLDLCYVHPRVIVMGYPASGLESMFRNPRGEVQRLLEERHAGRYFVYNFCDEPRRSYPASAFDGRVQRFPIEDHNVPTLQQATAFCEHAATWLAGDDQRVVALHCKAGKGRAGMMACMLLVRLGFVGTADEAIECYNSVRVRDRLGLTVTSQKKWVRYYASLWSSTAVPQASPAIAEPTLMIDQLALRNTLTGAEPPELRLRVFQLDPATSRKTLVFQSLGHDEFPVEKQVRGSVQIEFHRVGYGDCRPVKHFKVWINTLLVATDLETRRRVVVPRADMDWVRRDRKMQRFPAAFELELLLAAPGEGPRAAEVVQPPHE